MNIFARLRHHREPETELPAWENIAAALRELPIPARPRDFALSETQAAALHAPAAAGLRAWRPRPRFALAPLAALAVITALLPALLGSPTGALPGAPVTPAVVPGATTGAPFEGVPAQVNVSNPNAGVKLAPGAVCGTLAPATSAASPRPGSSSTSISSASSGGAGALVLSPSCLPEIPAPEESGG